VSDGSRTFRFVQFEFPWELGPTPGRYGIREQTGELPNQVFVLTTLGAPERRRLLARRRPREAAPRPDPEPVTTSRATLVDAAALRTTQAAEDWLNGTDLEVVADEAIARLNRVLHAQRVAAADPYAREVGREQALVTRVGFGEGEDVSEGRWTRAIELPRPDPRRRGRGQAALRPQERLAAVLGGRDVALACEELALRSRGDLDAGREREAALQLRAATDAALAELAPWGEKPLLTPRLDAVRELHDDVVAVAEAALRSGLDDDQVAVLHEAQRRLEAAVRARIAGGLD
jgi:hypothetical protein